MSATWYTTVAFGGNPAPVGPWRDPQAVSAAIRRWLRREGADGGTLVAAHTVRVHGYRTRSQARDGDISDGPGRDGCIEIHGLHDWLADHEPEEP